MTRIVVVTGASSGVGRATAIAFARTGAQVGLVARGLPGLEAAARDVAAAGGTPLILQADVTDADALDAAATRVEEELGPIDVWVNNAMVAVLAKVKDTDPADLRHVTDVTYHGFVHGTMSALRRMAPRDRGTIVQVGSALSHRAIPLQASYCGAKFAIRGFTDSLRCELLDDGSNVRLTMVQLPGLNTPQFTNVRTTLARKPQPVPPIFQPEVAARAIVWAADHPRREVHVGANTAVIIAGNKVAPWLGDRYLGATNVEDQQTDEPLEPGREDYLYASLDIDYGAHGPFGDEAEAASRYFDVMVRGRNVLLAAAGAAVGAGILGFRQHR